MPALRDTEYDSVEVHGEASPLLSNDERPLSPSKSPARWQISSPTAIITLLSVIKFAVVTSGMMILLPLYRLIEDSLCHVYYADDSLDPIDEMRCKVDEVQSQLAVLMGWFGLSTSVMGLLVAFPYGILADKIGRKPTVLISYSAMALSFLFGPLFLFVFQRTVRRNPYILMLGQLFQLFGGSVHVLLATLYAISADVSDAKAKASSFLSLTFGATLGGLVGPLMAGSIMGRYGPWATISMVVCSSPIVFIMLLLLPETLPARLKTHSISQNQCRISFWDHMRHGLADLKICLNMLRNSNISLILVTFFSQNARVTAYTGILMQYISRQFGWTLSQTNILLSPLSMLNLAVILVLPWVSRFLTSPRVGMSGFRKDLFLTQVSTLLLILGAVVEGVSPNVVLFLIGLFINTFGAADSPLARATISHYVEGDHTSRLYALITIAEVIGSFAGGPVLAFFFAKGLQWKGHWIGLPWFYIASLCFVCWIALLFVQEPKAAGLARTYGEGDEAPSARERRREGCPDQ